MSSTVAVVILILWGAIGVSISVTAPYPLSDQNAFLKGFVNHEFLSFMGVIVTISLASATNLYLELNKLEERLDMEAFTRSKCGARDSAYALLAMLAVSVVIVVLKPLMAVNHHWEAVMNSAAIAVIMLAIMILIDLTQAAFSLDFRGMPDPLTQRFDRLLATMASGQTPDVTGVGAQTSGEASSVDRDETQTPTDTPEGA